MNTIKMGRNKTYYMKGDKERVKLENKFEIALKLIMEDCSVIQKMMKMVASYSNMPKAIDSIVIQLASAFMDGVVPTRERELIDDPRIAKCFKLPKKLDNYDRTLVYILVALDDELVYLNKERPKKGKFGAFLEKYLKPFAEQKKEDDDLILVYLDEECDSESS